MLYYGTTPQTSCQSTVVGSLSTGAEACARRTDGLGGAPIGGVPASGSEYPTDGANTYMNSYLDCRTNSLDIRQSECVGTDCWAKTGFTQAAFLQFANSIQRHDWTSSERWSIQIFNQGTSARRVTNADCRADGSFLNLVANGFVEDDEGTRCLLVFTGTGTITVAAEDSDTSVPEKPAFTILAPQATVQMDADIGYFDGVIIADKLALPFPLSPLPVGKKKSGKVHLLTFT